MGDEVKVRVIKVDVDNREIHFELTDSDNGEENPAGLQVSRMPLKIFQKNMKFYQLKNLKINLMLQMEVLYLMRI